MLRTAAPDTARGDSLHAYKIREVLARIQRKDWKYDTVLEGVCRQQQALGAVWTALLDLTKVYRCLPRPGCGMVFMPKTPIYLILTCTYLFGLLAWTCTVVIFGPNENSNIYIVDLSNSQHLLWKGQRSSWSLKNKQMIQCYENQRTIMFLHSMKNNCSFN